MAFVIKKKESFIWPVTMKLAADGGKYDEQVIDLEFRHMKDSELQKILKKSKSDKEFCKAVVVGWKDVKDENSNPVDFSGFDDFLENVQFAATISTAYLKIVGGSVEKN